MFFVYRNLYLNLFGDFRDLQHPERNQITGCRENDVVRGRLFIQLTLKLPAA